MSEAEGTTNVEAAFCYLEWDNLFHKEKPFEILIDIPPEASDQRKTNLTFQHASKELVRDARPNLADLKLDIHGFECLLHHSQLKAHEFRDRKKVEQVYLPECETLLKDHVQSVDDVYIYNWRLRCSEDPDQKKTIINFSDPTNLLGPARHVHVDQSPSTIVERVGIHLPEQEDFLLRGRVRHVNIWRPIGGPVLEWPLAVCDGRSMPKENLIETSRIKRQYAGDTLFALYDEGYQWYYINKQQDFEPLLVKSFDSEESVTGCKWYKYASVESQPG